MKTIVISGASSGVGKTTLANAVASLLEESVAVKIGHHEAREGRNPWLYPMGTSLSRLAEDHHSKRFLIIESNSILRDMTPDLCIYLDGPEPKPSAAHARECADMRRGEQCSADIVHKIAGQLEIEDAVVRTIAWLAGARPELFTIGILAGGEGRRMGCDKALLEIEGRPAVIRLHEILKRQCDRVIIAAKSTNAVSFPGMEVVVDRVSGKGPLMGIVSVLAASSSDLTGIVACDIPDIDPNLFPRLCGAIGDADAAVATFDGIRKEPLLAVYRKSVLLPARKALEAGEFRIIDLLRGCRTKTIHIPDGGWYHNLNTPESVIFYVNKR